MRWSLTKSCECPFTIAVIKETNNRIICSICPRGFDMSLLKIDWTCKYKVDWRDRVMEIRFDENVDWTWREERSNYTWKMKLTMIWHLLQKNSNFELVETSYLFCSVSQKDQKRTRMWTELFRANDKVTHDKKKLHDVLAHTKYQPYLVRRRYQFKTTWECIESTAKRQDSFKSTWFNTRCKNLCPNGNSSFFDASKCGNSLI